MLVWPVRVQGEGSAAEVTAAIRGFNALPKCGAIPQPDLIIVARGGGSLEDLWSFNEENVVRAAAESMIPLISAVGHETDVTLIDFAADVRAPTPTAAAEMAVPVRAELLVRVDSCARRALACWQRSQESRRTELRAAARALPNAEELLALPRQRLDQASARLPRALIANAQLHHAAYSRLAGRLTPQTLGNHIARERERTAMLARRSAHCLRVHVERRRERYDAFALRLDAARTAYVQRPHDRDRARCASASRCSRSRAQRAFERLLRRPRRARRARRAAAGGRVLSRRAGARLCAGARSRRPAVAAGRRRHRRRAHRHRVFRRPRARARRGVVRASSGARRAASCAGGAAAATTAIPARAACSNP